MKYSGIKRSDDTQSINWGKLVQALDEQNLAQIEKWVKALIGQGIDDIGLLLPLAVEKGNPQVVNLLLHDSMGRVLRNSVLAKAEGNKLSLVNITPETKETKEIKDLVRRSYGRAQRTIPDTMQNQAQTVSNSSSVSTESINSSSLNHSASSSSMNPVYNNQRTYLSDYAEKGDINAIQRADLDEFSPNEIGETLAIAVKNSNLPIVKSLLEGDRLFQEDRQLTLQAAERYNLLDHAAKTTPEIRTILSDQGYKRAGMNIPIALPSSESQKPAANPISSNSTSSSSNRNAAPRVVSSMSLMADLPYANPALFGSSSREVEIPQTTSRHSGVLYQPLSNLSLNNSSSSSATPVANFPHTPDAFYSAALKNDQPVMSAMLAQRNFKNMPELLKGEAKDHAPLVHALKSNNNGLVQFLMSYYETAKLDIPTGIFELANDHALNLLLETGTKTGEWHDCCNAIKNNPASALMTVESYLNLKQDKAVLIQKLDGRGHELLQAARNSGNQTLVDVINNVYHHSNHPIPVKTGLQVTYQGQQQPGVPSAPPAQQHGFQQGN